MKKVAASKQKQSIFDDPLFNPGESFNKSNTDDYVAPLPQPSKELLNTLTISDEESLSTITKPMKTRKMKPQSNQESTSDDGNKPPSVHVAPDVDKPLHQERADPLKTAAVLDTDGEDLFLPGSDVDKSKKSNVMSFEEELFGKSSASSSELSLVKPSGKELLVGTHETGDDNKINDLAVGAIMEREELDFDMFGKSKLRQYEPMDTTKKGGASGIVGSDDLVLESSDVFSDFESLLSDSGKSKKSTISAVKVSSTSPTSKTVVVDSAYDIDAYISQQEESGGGGLFD